jgi:hypothetical protein
MFRKPAFFSNMKGWERLSLAATIIGAVVGVFAFFVYPTYQEIMAFPTVWSQEKGANTVTIYRSGDEIREQGELPFLLLDVPYTAEFQCQLKKARHGHWEGKCLYHFKGAGQDNNLNCSVTTNEEIDLFTKSSITGSSQPLNDPRGPNQCPNPKGGPAGKPTEYFELHPK